ncbi:MAG: hypothetical protein PHV93_03600 [Candidatus Pacebacteria bacterium]|nr:hypothetical protein [Candidatus Paceibacterota bacterium]
MQNFKIKKPDGSLEPRSGGILVDVWDLLVPLEAEHEVERFRIPILVVLPEGELLQVTLEPFGVYSVVSLVDERLDGLKSVEQFRRRFGIPSHPNVFKEFPHVLHPLDMFQEEFIADAYGQNLRRLLATTNLPDSEFRLNSRFTVAVQIGFAHLVAELVEHIEGRLITLEPQQSLQIQCATVFILQKHERGQKPLGQRNVRVVHRCADGETHLGAALGALDDPPCGQTVTACTATIRTHEAFWPACLNYVFQADLIIPEHLLQIPRGLGEIPSGQHYTPSFRF